MTHLCFQSATVLAAALRNREIGARELLDQYLARAERLDPSINAICAYDIEVARARADAADAATARGTSWGPLHGLPMTVKESFDAVGMPTTWGIPELRDSLPTQDSNVVRRLKAAGAVIFGKTNVPLHLADTQTFNAIYGTTNNPWDLTRTPGGSSGGSAAALAAGLTGFEVGSDIGGSIRYPAHFCGVWGHKPTWGLVSPRGQALAGRVSTGDIAVVGPLGRSAEDLALGLDILAGPDAIDGRGWRLDLPAPRQRRLADYRVAVMLDDPNSEVDANVAGAIDAVADFLASQGATVDRRARPDIDTREAQRLYMLLVRSTTAARMQTEEGFALNSAIVAGLDPSDQSHYARHMRGMTLSHRDWLIANEARHKMRLAWDAFFRDWDVLLLPPSASPAYLHTQEGERWVRGLAVNGREVAMLDQTFWAGFTGMCLLPSTVAPIGTSAGGLPVGVQIAGAQYDDRTTIDFARLLEQEWRGFVAPPGFE